MIRYKDGKYVLYNSRMTCKLGEFDTKEEALHKRRAIAARLKQESNIRRKERPKLKVNW